jgi:hypothetical protein
VPDPGAAAKSAGSATWTKGIPHPNPRLLLQNGTVTLFASLDYLEGKVIAHTTQKHTHCRGVDFLKEIYREFPLSQHIRIILYNSTLSIQSSSAG